MAIYTCLCSLFGFEKKHINKKTRCERENTAGKTTKEQARERAYKTNTSIIPDYFKRLFNRSISSSAVISSISKSSLCTTSFTICQSKNIKNSIAKIAIVHVAILFPLLL
jgi:hypothetical protein